MSITPLNVPKSQQLNNAAEVKKILYSGGNRANAVAEAADRIRTKQIREADIDASSFVRNTELDDFTGAATNTGIAAAQGVGRIVGNVASLPDNAESSRLLSRIPDNARAALQRELQGETLTPEEESLLNQQIDLNEQDQVGQFTVPTDRSENLATPREIYNQYRDVQNDAQRIKDSFTTDTAVNKAFNPLNRESLINDLDNSWDRLNEALSDDSGAFGVTAASLDLIGDALSDLVSNPAATVEFAAESLPNALTALNPVTAATNTAAFGGDIFGQNLRDKATDNEVVSSDKQQELLQEASFGAGLEYASNALVAGAAGLRGTAAPTTEAVRRSLLESTGRRAGTIAGTTANEALTEGVQTAIENDAFGDDFNFATDGREVFQGAAIGLGASAATIAPGQTAGQVRDTVNAASETIQAGSQQIIDNNEESANRVQSAVNNSLENNDFNSLIEGSIQQVENGNKFDLDQKLSDIASRHSDAVNTETPNFNDAQRLESAYIQTVIAAYDKRAELAEQITNETDPKRRKQLSTQWKALKETLDESEKELEVVQANQAKLIKPNESVEEVVSAEQRDDNFDIHAQRIFDTNATNPDALPVEQVEKLLTSESWTPAEREQLVAIAAAKVARNEVLDNPARKTGVAVHGEIIKGSKDNRGADQYRRGVVAAIQAGDIPRANAIREKFSAFVDRHSAKARDFNAAYQPYLRQQREGFQAAPITQDETRAAEFVAQQYRTLKGRPTVIDGRSGSLVNTVNLEVQALQASLNEVDSLIQNQDLISQPTLAPQPQPAASVSTPETIINTTPEATTQPTQEVNTTTETVTAPETTESVAEVVQEAGTVQTPEAVTTTEQTVQSEEPSADAVVSQSTSTEETVTTEAEPTEQVAPAEEALSLRPDSLFNRWFRAGTARGFVSNTTNAVQQLRETPEAVLTQSPDEELTERQSTAIEHFVQFADNFGSTLDELVKDQNDYQYNMHLFFSPDGQNMTEATKAAMSAVAYNWLAFDARDTIRNNTSKVANMFNLNEDQVNNELVRVMSTAGVTRSQLASSLGRDIVSTLGLQVNRDTANDDKLAEMHSALGSYLIGAMVDQNLLEMPKINVKDLRNVMGPGATDFLNGLSDRTDMFFARVPVNDDQLYTDNMYPDHIKDIIETNKDTNRIVGSLIDTTSVPTPPSLEPNTNVVSKQKNTVRDVAPRIRSILTKAQAKPWSLAEETDRIFNIFNAEDQARIAGVVDQARLDTMPVGKRISAQAKNDSLIQEIENYHEWRNSLESLDTPFYFSYEIWKNQRIGISNTLVNPQSSKIHRGLIGLQSWRKEIDSSNQEQVDQFLLGVAQGLGIDIDKLTVATALKELQDFRDTNPGIDEAAQAIAALSFDENLEDASQLRETILQAVELGGENTHTLLALSNLGRYLQADGGTFTSDLWTELDGITNGPIIGLMQFGNGPTEYMKSLLTKGGLFFDGLRSYGQYKEANQEDLYEELSTSWSQRVRDLASTLQGRDVVNYQNIAAIFGDIGRKLAKDPLMTNVYGAGTASINQALGNRFLERVDDVIDDIVNGDPTRVASDLATLSQRLTNLSNMEVNITPENALEHKLDWRAEQNIRQQLTLIYGEPLGDAIKDVFSTFMENRKVFNTQLQSMNEVFLEVLDEQVTKRKAELVEQGTITSRESLPQTEVDAIINTLQPLVPGLKTAFSTEANEQIQVTKQESVQSPSNRRVVARFSRKLNNLGNSEIGSSLTIRQFKEQLGVEGAILNIHSLDATVALSALDQLDVLNVHDGFPTGVLEAQNAGKFLNTAFIKAMSQRNVYRDMTEYTNKAIDLVESLDSANAKDHLAALIAIRDNFTGLDNVTSRVRNELLNDLEYVTQYNFEDSGYETKKGKANTGQASLPPVQSTWGAVAPVKSQDPFANLFEQAADASDSAKTVFTRLFERRKTKSVQATIIKQLLPLIPNGLKVKVIRPNSGSTGDAQVDEVLAGSYGVFSESNRTIYLKSTEFKHNGTNIETASHELIHALSTSVIGQVERGTNKDPRAVKAVENLNNLLDEVKTKLDRQGFDYNPEAVKNVQEFLSYGLTDTTFQNQLQQLKVVRRGDRLSALKEFVQAVTRVLFGKRSVNNENALRQLIGLTAEVIDIQNREDQGIELNPDVHAQTIEKMSSEEIFDGLADDTASRDAAHIQHIRNLQTDLVNKITGPQGARLFEAEQNLGDEVDQYLNHLAQGTSPFIAAIGKVFKLTPQEAYVTEQLEAVFASDLSKAGFDRDHMRRLWKQAKDVVQVSDFLDDPTVTDDAAMEVATDRYNFIFRPTVNKVDSQFDGNAGKVVVNATSDYLQRFAILATTHGPTRQRLSQLTPNDEASVEDSSFLKQVGNTIGRVIDRLRDLFLRTHTPTGSIAKRTETLLDNLAVINRKKKLRLLDLGDQIGGINETANKKLSEILTSGLKSASLSGLKDSKIPLVAAGATAAGIVANNQGEPLIETLYKFRDSHNEGRHGFVLQAIEELRGVTANNKKLVDILRWANRDNEQKRRQVKEWTRELINDAFSNSLSEQEEAALTKVAIKGDLVSLLPEYTIQQLDSLLSDPEALAKEIQAAETELKRKDIPNDIYYMNQAEALGRYMVTGHGTNTLVKNAHGIANLFGTDQSVSQRTVKEVTPIIDTLASLHAMAYMSQADKDSVVQLIRKDAGEAVQFTMKQHASLKQDALENTFSNDPALMQKGFAYEITNPHTSVQWAGKNSQEAKALIAQGYTEVFETKRDELDPENQTSSMFLIEDGGMVQRLTGVMSFTNKAAKGTRFADAARQVGNTGLDLTFEGDLKQMQQKVSDSNKDLFTTRRSPKAGSRLIPIFNPSGDVVDYRYEMSEKVRERVLEKNYKVGDVLGSMAGAIVDKVSTTDINNQTIDALHEQFSQDSTSTQSTYISVHADSNDPEIRDIWAMLPFEAKQQAIAKFGQPKIMIKPEHLTLVFGYRKSSISSLFTRDADVSSKQALKNAAKLNGQNAANELSLLEHALRFALEASVGRVLGEKLALRAKQAEDIVQMLVTGVKDIYVVKNIFTTVGNIISNAALLNISGVPFTDMIKDQAVAWRGAQRYTAHQKEIFKLESQLKALPALSPRRSEINGRINELNNELIANPVHELMEAGMFQTIVEDIDATIDPYSYKSKFIKRLDNLVGDRVSDGVKTFGKYLFITQDTNLYKFLNHPIQLSDFSARYAQFKYLTETKSEPLSKEAAFTQITENFINYDMPTNRTLQYLNDLGLVMFTKYFMRIQKPILNLFIRNPANVLMSLMAQQLLGFSSPTDSSVVNQGIMSRFHNPFGNMLDAPDEIATINGLFHLGGVK